MATYDFVGDVRLTPTERVIGQKIDQLVRRGHDLIHATKTIAEAIGRSVRTVQDALNKFAKLGLVARLWDYGLRSRRRYLLLWRPETERPPGLFHDDPGPAMNATGCVESAQDFAVTTGVPLEPPIGEPEGNTRGESVDVPTKTTAPQVTSSAGESVRAASPDDLSKAFASAKAIFGDGAEPKIRAAVKTYSLAWVVRALEFAAGVKLRDGKVGWGYMVVTLRSWLEEDGPPPAASELLFGEIPTDPIFEAARALPRKLTATERLMAEFQAEHDRLVAEQREEAGHVGAL